MKGFIKVVDLRDKEHYINVAHIIKFSPVDPSFQGTTNIRITGGDNTTSIVTESIIDEIVSMIESANR